MARPTIQSSFNSGEWAPSLYARVDMEKYHSGAALLRNFFVDYRGGASSRPGTRYIIRCADNDNDLVRLIPFQVNFSVGYVLEFGDQYIRFIADGAPILETGLNITGVSQANPCVVSVANSYTVSTHIPDMIYITDVQGMTQLNNRYFLVGPGSTGSQVVLYDLFNNPVNSTGYSAYTSAGTTQRIYKISSPYAPADLAKIKFVQNVDTMILCHPNYVPYMLKIVSATNWQLTPITFGTSVPTPTGWGTSSSLGAGNVNYSYIVTTVDEDGQESAPSPQQRMNGLQDLRTVAGTNTVHWTAVVGAQSYNAYKSSVGVIDTVPDGVPHGFIGNFTTGIFADSNIAPDMSQSPPVQRNPFVTGSGVTSTSISNAGSYTTAPSITFGAPSTPGGIVATGAPVMDIVGSANVAPGTGYAVDDLLTFVGNVIIRVLTIGGGGAIASYSVINNGSYTGILPTNPVSQTSTSGSGIGATFTFSWGVFAINVTNPGSGYTSPPAITFSAGSATASSAIGPATAGNPSVPAFFQQRLVLGGPLNATQTLYFSQPGSFFNFDVSNPIQDDDAITASLISGHLNNIKAMISQTAGLLVLTDGGSWLINGGSAGSAISPAALVANAQSFIGCSDLPPIVANYDVLYAQSRGSGVRDTAYNFYFNVYTGVDISVISSHLFYGFQLQEWAWVEEPFKTVWAVRNDGTLLSLTFIREQDFVAWAHSDTDGLFNSVCTIVEPLVNGYANALYTVVSRTINGQTIRYIERFAERSFSNGVIDAWCVDCGLQYTGTPATHFTGGEHLTGKTIVGLADGQPITPFVMPASGAFTLPTAASKVTIGLSYTSQLKTLPIDQGNPTIQSKEKKINAVTVRVAQSLGLSIGSTFSNLVSMKDLVRGNVGSMTNEVVTDLVTGDTRTFLDPSYTVPGQYCIQAASPYPASVLGVIPQLAVGDTQRQGGAQ